MITFISGAPGTGKSAALVSMLAELGKDRQIFVHGIPDLRVPHEVLEDPTKWHETVPDGSVMVVDEAQNFLRPAGPGQKPPEYIAKHETHRHRGIDIYYISQGPNLIHANVRALIGRHVHLRDLGVLGRWWYEWPECADNCRTAWKNAPIKKRYRLPKHVFSQYKSASLHVKPIRSFPWMLVVMVVALIALAVLVWRVYGIISDKNKPVAPPGQTFPSSGPSASVKDAASGMAAAVDPSVGPVDDRVAWIPRVSSKPESAPAFDHLRAVAVMPVVAGGVCGAKGCVCYSQQGTVLHMSVDECRAWIAAPPFNPYAMPVSVSAVETLSGYRPPSSEPPFPAPQGGALAASPGLAFPSAMPSIAPTQGLAGL